MQADGHVGRIAALAMIELGADKAYGAGNFVNELRSMNASLVRAGSRPSPSFAG